MKLMGLTLLALVLILAACTGGAAAPTDTPSTTATRAPLASPPATTTATSTPLTSPSPTARPTPTPTAVAVPEAFFLEIAAPKNESVVRESSLMVRGRTVPDAVVSVNGQPVEVDASGNFSTTVTLEEGPNALEVIASDFRGHQQSRVVSVIYVR